MLCTIHTNRFHSWHVIDEVTFSHVDCDLAVRGALLEDFKVVNHFEVGGFYRSRKNCMYSLKSYDSYFNITRLGLALVSMVRKAVRSFFFVIWNIAYITSFSWVSVRTTTVVERKLNRADGLRLPLYHFQLRELPRCKSFSSCRGMFWSNYCDFCLGFARIVLFPRFPVCEAMCFWLCCYRSPGKCCLFGIDKGGWVFLVLVELFRNITHFRYVCNKSRWETIWLAVFSLKFKNHT